MAKLIYASLTSLDGYVADENGNFDWIEPDEEMQAFINGPQVRQRHDSRAVPSEEVTLRVTSYAPENVFLAGE